MPLTSESTFVHVFAFRWKPAATPSQQQEAAQQIRAFQDVIPGLLQTHVGQNVSERNGGYTFGGVMHFTDQAAFQAYTVHPAHMALVSWLMPLIDALELDLKA